MESAIKSFPFPVLGNQDDIRGKFNTSFYYTLQPESITLDCEFDLSNPTIEDLVASGIAHYAIQVVCSSTFYRKIFYSKERIVAIEIEAGDLRDRVEVEFYICSSAEIDRYKPEGIHADLEGEPVVVEKGDVLALGGRAFFIADKSFDPMKTPVSSFMRIKEGSKQDDSIVLEYRDEEILIILSKNDYNNYKYARKYIPSMLHSSIVFPALIDVLVTIGKDEGTHGSANWFGRIKQICIERKINLDDPFIAAQELLGKPVQRSLEDYKSSSIENGEGEME
jgi:hypothetical protein